MGLAPKGLNVGDTFEDEGKKYRVKAIITTPYYEGYDTEVIEDDAECGLPFVTVGNEKAEEVAEEPAEEAEKKPAATRRTVNRKRTVRA